MHIRYGLHCVTFTTDQSEFFSSDNEEIVHKGAELLDYALELISNGTSRESEEAVKLLEAARFILEQGDKKNANQN